MRHAGDARRVNGRPSPRSRELRDIFAGDARSGGTVAGDLLACDDEGNPDPGRRGPAGSPAREVFDPDLLAGPMFVIRPIRQRGRCSFSVRTASVRLVAGPAVGRSRLVMSGAEPGWGPVLPARRSGRADGINPQALRSRRQRRPCWPEYLDRHHRLSDVLAQVEPRSTQSSRTLLSGHERDAVSGRWRGVGIDRSCASVRALDGVSGRKLVFTRDTRDRRQPVLTTRVKRPWRPGGQLAWKS